MEILSTIIAIVLVGILICTFFTARCLCKKEKTATPAPATTSEKPKQIEDKPEDSGAKNSFEAKVKAIHQINRLRETKKEKKNSILFLTAFAIVAITIGLGYVINSLSEEAIATHTKTVNPTTASNDTQSPGTENMDISNPIPTNIDSTKIDSTKKSITSTNKADTNAKNTHPLSTNTEINKTFFIGAGLITLSALVCVGLLSWIFKIYISHLKEQQELEVKREEINNSYHKFLIQSMTDYEYQQKPTPTPYTPTSTTETKTKKLFGREITSTEHQKRVN